MKRGMIIGILMLVLFVGRSFGARSDGNMANLSYDDAYWNLQTRDDAEIVTNPVTGKGRVLEIPASASAFDTYRHEVDSLIPVDLSHSFNTTEFGTFSVKVDSTFTIFRIATSLGTLRFQSGYVAIANTGPDTVLTQQPLDLTGWNTYSVTLNGKTASVFIDGKLYARTAFTGGFNDIGMFFNGGNNYIEDAKFKPSNPVGDFKDTPIAAVPEPSTFVLLGSGLIGMLGYFSRKKRRFNLYGTAQQ
jgi:hypothetical protein